MASANPSSAASANEGAASAASVTCHDRRTVSAPMARPSSTPALPIAAASHAARRTSVPTEAPRMRSRPCSRRRRSAPEDVTASVTSSASTTPGAPRNRNSTRAYSASARTPSRRAARLLAIAALPATWASTLFARPSTCTYAAAGSEGSAAWSSRMCSWVRTVSGRTLRCASNSVCQVAIGISNTLSGGACGAVPLGTPIAWNIESAFGSVTTPAMRTSTGGTPIRSTLTVSPTVTCRLVAVWVEINTPSAVPSTTRTWSGKRAV